jgi:hypothetical protein
LKYDVNFENVICDENLNHPRKFAILAIHFSCKINKIEPRQLYYLATKLFVVIDCDSNQYDVFACDRESWSCDAPDPGQKTCSHDCSPTGHCSCPETHFLTDFFTCTEKPTAEEIECYDTHMVAWFDVAQVGFALGKL